MNRGDLALHICRHLAEHPGIDGFAICRIIPGLSTELSAELMYLDDAGIITCNEVGDWYLHPAWKQLFKHAAGDEKP